MQCPVCHTEVASEISLHSAINCGAKPFCSSPRPLKQLTCRRPPPRHPCRLPPAAVRSRLPSPPGLALNRSRRSHLLHHRHSGHPLSSSSILYKKMPLVRFHSFQNIFMVVAWVAFWIVVAVFSAILAFIPFAAHAGDLPHPVRLSTPPWDLGFFILWLMAIIKASKGESGTRSPSSATSP